MTDKHYLQQLKKKIDGHHTVLAVTQEITEKYHELIRLKNNNDLNDREKIAIETEKCTLIQLLKENIQKKQKQENNANTKCTKIPLHKKIFGYFYASMGSLFAGINGFTAGSQLLKMFLNVTNPVSLGSGIVFALLQGILFLGIDVREARNKFGVSVFNTKPIVRAYKKQIAATENLQNKLLSSFSRKNLNIIEYSAYQKALNLIQDDIQNKYAATKKEIEQNSLQKGIRYAASILNCTLNVVSGMVFGKQLLLLFGAAALVTTPIGWVVAGTVGAFSLATFFYLRRKSIFNFMDAAVGFPKSLKKMQDNFIHGKQGVLYFKKELKEIIVQKFQDEKEQQATKNQILQLEQKITSLQNEVIKGKEDLKITTLQPKLSSFSMLKKRKFEEFAKSTSMITKGFFADFVRKKKHCGLSKVSQSYNK